MKGSRPAKVNAGETAKVTIPLAPDAGSIARTFLIHFTSNKAFVEPCMRKVLQQAVAFAGANKDDKLIIVGHTDKVDTDEYNQSLSERRARSVYAFLTFGRDPAAALREWQELRKARPKGEIKTVKDSWGLRQFQHMLQDLGFYPGNVDGKPGPLTDSAVRAFRCKAGLPPGQDLDEPTLDALSKAYMAQDGFALPTSRFLPNCSADDVLKWLGCGERDPVKNVATAWRPNRRVELMFVKVAKLPCDVPPPDTLEMVPDGAGSAKWCLPKGAPANRTCFVFPALPKKGAKPAPGQLVRQPVESGTLDVTGTILRQARNKDGTTVINDDGTVKLEPVPGGQPFFVIAADGEIQVAENPANGEPVATRTGAKGSFKFSGKRTGVYELVALGSVLARLAEDGDGAVKGNAVCKRLATADDHLDVVLINAPVLREIRLPVAVHLLTALDPATRRPRPSQLPGNENLEEAATLDEDDTRERFDGGAGAALTVNFIWRQARIRFEVKDVVQEVFATPGRSAGSVDIDEIARLLGECSPPNVVSVFLTLSLRTSGGGDGGATVSPESAAAQGLKAGGSFVSQRIRGTLLGVPVSPELDRSKLVEVLAHELGHFVLGHLSNAEHADGSDPDRLMLPSSAIGTGVHIRLIQDEVDRSRSRRAASFACIPLTLEVKGAAQAGGVLSHRFFAVQSAGPAPDVEVTARISDELAALGTVAVQCATAKVVGRQCFVSTTQIGTHEIEAAYTPAAGGEVKIARAIVRVVNFTLRVEGNDGKPLQPLQPGSSTFATVRAAGRAVFVVAQIAPQPFCVPRDLVQWTNGLEQSDPLRRAARRGLVAATRVTAKIGDAVRFVDIVVVETALASNQAPFDQAFQLLDVRGVLNSDRKSFGIANLFGDQPDRVFRVRGDVPDVQGAPAATKLQGKLTSLAPDGTVIETLNVTLNRGTGDRFVSLPILAIPEAIPRADIQFKAPQSIEVLRCRAEGKVRLAITELAVLDPLEIPVQGLVADLCSVTIKGATTHPDRDVAAAQRVWAQVGVEVRVLNPRTIDRPDLLHIDSPTKGPDPDEIVLFALGRDTCTADIIGYYVKSTSPPALGRTTFVANRPGFYATDAATQYTFGHELGHVLGLDHDQDSKNLMFEEGTSGLPGNARDVLLSPAQLSTMPTGDRLKNKP